ncbi:MULTISPECIES: siderophore-interacting protein [unclassified Actinobaculum]|uniref:siderophore-interacting protein n=1 Tax=unclassified Actinobaculum TaxID=2609299 RepID=UPI0013DD8CA8|nr:MULTISPECIES: siderophore-interacting protein [unclassified Actinobaculum]
MRQELSSTRPIRPTRASVQLLRVADSRRISPTFQRLSFAPHEESFNEEFDFLGFDQWFRFFFWPPLQERMERRAQTVGPVAGKRGSVRADSPAIPAYSANARAGRGSTAYGPRRPGLPPLPWGAADGWYQRYRALPAKNRPTVRNYTIRDARRISGTWYIDVDFAIHRAPDGQIEGRAARWARRAQRGELVGFLDQGRIFRFDGAKGPLLLVSDETGLPGIEGIARSLHAGGHVPETTAIIEVPTSEDRRDIWLDDVLWTTRPRGQEVGQSLLALLDHMPLSGFEGAYIVGEASFALAVRNRCLDAGMPRENIDFCGYWRKAQSADFE